MASETFIDTSGFYALLAAKDNQHSAARTFMRRAADERLPLVTTDYVLDETATLLVARGLQRRWRRVLSAPGWTSSITEASALAA